VMDTVQRLNDERDVTVAVVLHDIAQAARFADYLVALDSDRLDYSYRRLVAGAGGVGLLAFAYLTLTGGPSVSDTQVPVGIVTGLIGGPYFLYLMRRRTQLGDL